MNRPMEVFEGDDADPLLLLREKKKKRRKQISPRPEVGGLCSTSMTAVSMG